MKSISDKIKGYRRDNISALIKKHGSVISFANAITKSQAYVGQVRSGHRTLGEKLAREIETKLSLPFGYMDINHIGAGEPIDELLEQIKVMFNNNKISTEELALISQYRSLNEKQKKAVTDLIDFMV